MKHHLHERIMAKKKKIPEELKDRIVQNFDISDIEFVEYRRYKNSPVIINKDGEIIEIPPREESPIPISRRK